MPHVILIPLQVFGRVLRSQLLHERQEVRRRVSASVGAHALTCPHTSALLLCIARNAIIDYVGELDWSQEVMRRLQAEGMGPRAYKPPQGDGKTKAPVAPASREREAKYVPLSAVDVEDALPAADDHATAGVPVALDVADAPGPLVYTSPTWLAGARVYRELHAKAVAAAAREANVSWWGGFVMDDGFDDRRMRAYREAMPGLLRMQRRTVEGLKKSAWSVFV